MTLYETACKSVTEHSIMRWKKQTFDVQTANVIKTVYEALSEERRIKFEQMAEQNILRLIKFCWRCVE